MKVVGGVYGINVNRLIVKPDATKLEMEGGSAALKTSYKVIFEGLQGISLPENGEQSGIFIRDGSNPAKKAIVEPGYKRFNIWVGSTQVVGHNCSDILGDGGKAKFDLMTNTLTLNEPTITGNHAVNGTTATICSIETPLNVKGTYHMTEANAELGICTFDSSLSIDGDITCFGTLGGAYSGVYPYQLNHGYQNAPDNSLDGNVTLNGGYYGFASCGRVSIRGNCKFSGGIIGLSAMEAITIEDDALAIVESRKDDPKDINIGLWPHNYDLIVSGNARGLIADADVAVSVGGDLIINQSNDQKLKITQPSSATLMNRAIYYLSARTELYCEYSPAEHVEIAADHSIYVGNTRVTSLNRDNILNQMGDNGEPTAKYNPVGHKLTLNNPHITKYFTSKNGSRISIASPSDLTIEGYCDMTYAMADYGVYAVGSLELDGDLTFRGTFAGIASLKNIILRGNVTGVASESGVTYGILSDNGSIDIKNGTVNASGGFGLVASWVKLRPEVKKVTLDATTYDAIYANGGFEYPSSYMFMTPSNIYFDHTYHSFFEKPSTTIVSHLDNTIPTPPAEALKHVEIEQNAVYKLWVGDTQVMSSNMDDILGDGGKAKYDPGTKTLTLDNPEIYSVHEFVKYATVNEQHTATIYSPLDLTVKGEYQMTAAAADYGVMVESRDLTLDGDFTFKGTLCAVAAANLRLGDI